MRFVLKLKQKYFPKGIRRGVTRYKNKIFSRTTEGNLASSLARLEIKKGSVICIHSMLSGLGYIAGGPETVIRAIRKAVPESTIMMPTFPFDGTMTDYLTSNPVYHIEKTPSKSGLLSETLRLLPGSKRSYHPTHPCVALGPKADYLIDGSEKSQTPFGDDSTYGRFSTLGEAVLLLIHTNNTSLVHRVQEMVDMPNLFLNEPVFAKGYDRHNNLVDYTIQAHVPKIPLFVIMPGDGYKAIEYVWFPDYVLLFPQYNKVRILNKVKSERSKKMLIDRHEYFLQKGSYKIVRHRSAELAAVQVKPWLEKICSNVMESIETFSVDYSYRSMKQALEQGWLYR